MNLVKFYSFGLLFLLMIHTSFLKAHPGAFGTAFHAHTLKQAMSAAKDEHKIIFLYAGHGDRGWLNLRWPSSHSQALLNLIIREAIIIELNYHEYRDELMDFGLKNPQIAILEHDGHMLAQMPTNELTAKVQLELEKHVNSKKGWERIQLAMASGKNPFFNKERWAAALALKTSYEESLMIYNSLLEQSLSHPSSIAESRRKWIMDDLEAMMAKSSSVRNILKNNRQKAVQLLIRQDDKSDLAAFIARIDLILKEPESTRDLFDHLPKKSRARNRVFDMISSDLTSTKSYEDILAMIEPMDALTGEISLYSKNRILKPVTAERGEGRGTRSFVIERSTILIEALTGLGRKQEAEKLISKLLSFDSTSDTHSKIEAAQLRGSLSLN